MFANRSEDDKIYPLTISEIAEAQKADAEFKHYFKRNAVFDKGLEIKFVENTKCVCKEGRLVIPKPLQRRAVSNTWTHPSRRDDQCCDVLERYAYHHPVNNEVLQNLPDK